MAAKKKAAKRRKAKVKKTKFKVLSKKKVAFTVDRAYWYLELPSFEGERAVNVAHAQRLCDQMEKGEFLFDQAEISVAKCKWDGKVRKLNGQHTCTARFGLSDSFNPQITITEYEVKSEDEYRLLYAKFDRGQARTRSQVTVASLAGTPEYLEFSRQVLTNLAKGYGDWNANGIHTRTLPPEEIAERLRKRDRAVGTRVAPYVRDITRGGKSNSMLRRKAVYSAMFETFNKFPQASDSFWTKVISGVGFRSAMDPALHLRNYLTSVSLGEKSKNKRVAEEEMFNVCVACFNNHKRGKMLRSCPPGKRPKRVVAK